MWPLVAEKLKQYLPKILSYLAVLVVGIAIGWGMKPDQVRVEEKIRVEQVEKQVVVVKEQVRVEIVKVRDSQVLDKTHTETTETKSPDGTVVTKTIEDKNVDSVVHDRENTTEVKVVEVTKEVVVVKTETVEKISKPVLPDWRVGVLVGIQPVILPTPGIPGYVYGAEIERRIVGPFSLGLFGTLDGHQQATVGAKVGFEF
jgi:hypothetical protein